MISSSESSDIRNQFLSATTGVYSVLSVYSPGPKHVMLKLTWNIQRYAFDFKELKQEWQKTVFDLSLGVFPSLKHPTSWALLLCNCVQNLCTGFCVSFTLGFLYRAHTVYFLNSKPHIYLYIYKSLSRWLRLVVKLCCWKNLVWSNRATPSTNENKWRWPWELASKALRLLSTSYSCCCFKCYWFSVWQNPSMFQKAVWMKLSIQKGWKERNGETQKSAVSGMTVVTVSQTAAVR